MDSTKFLDKYYASRDPSHGKEHVMKVCANALLILTDNDIINHSKRDTYICIMASLYHDAYDHKYTSVADALKIKKELYDDLLGISALTKSDVDVIINIIDNVSFSHEKKTRINNKQVDLGKDQILLDVVRDADRLEALGEIGIKRMVQFHCIDGSYDIDTIIHHIHKHSNEKLFILIEENYIKTRMGRKLAKRLLYELKQIVNNDTLLREKITFWITTV